MALLAWEKNRKVFLKIQEGIGDNLLHEDRAAGYVDYTLWSVFKAEDMELDGELTMNCIDNGMVLSKVPTTEAKSLAACCQDAFGNSPCDLAILME